MYQRDFSGNYGTNLEGAGDMVNLPNVAKAVPNHLNTVAKNKTLREFYVLCSISATIFFGGLVVVLLRAKPIEVEEASITIDHASELEQRQEN